MKEESSFKFLTAGYGFALLAIAAATLIALPLREHFDAINLVMFYLAAVVAVAARAGTRPSLLASIIGVSAFNFFFTEPYYTLQINDSSYVFTFIVMLITSLVIGSLAARSRQQAMLARQEQEKTAALYALTRQLASVRGKEAIATAASRHIATYFTMQAIVMTDEPQESPWSELTEKSAAVWALEHGEAAGVGTDTFAGADGLYLPLIAEGETVGVLGIIGTGISPDQRQALEAHALLIASALARVRKAEAAELAKVESETEKTRNVMLRAVSHDLRTPLASIRGNIEAALSAGAKLPPEITALLTSARSQSEHMTRMITNLLDITRLETGALMLNRQPYYIDEVIGAALGVIQLQLGNRNIHTDIPANLPMVDIDGLLIEQVLLNLLENAIRHTQDNGNIIISASESGQLELGVADDGAGINAGEETRIFDKFYHGNTGGTGLGLAICKGIVGAHGGSIRANRNPSGGLTIRFTLPFAQASRKVASA